MGEDDEADDRKPPGHAAEATRGWCPRGRAEAMTAIAVAWSAAGGSGGGERWLDEG